MFGFRKNDKKIDVASLNELILISKYVVKIIFILGIVLLIYVLTRILIDWGIIGSIITLLKIILPFFIGIIIAWLLDPLVNMLVRKNMKRSLATFIVFILFLCFLVASIALIIPTLIDQAREFAMMIPKIIDNSKSYLDNLFNDLTNLYDYNFENIKENIYLSFNNFSDGITVGLPTLVVDMIGSILSGGVTIVVGLFIGFYMLFDFNNVRKKLFSFLPKKIHKDTVILTDRLNSSLKNYVQGTIFVTLILFTVQTIGFFIAGLKAPVVFGLVCAVTNIIPYVGPYIGGIPAVLVGFAISPVVGILTLISVILCQFLESYVLTPIILSKTMKLHPVTIIIGLLIFGHFFGIFGMLFSTPIIACLKIIFNFFDEKYKILDMINN